MAKIYFIADLHLGDSAIIRYENRPFHNVDEMNNKLVSNWNSIVDKEDTVFVVGDFISNLKSFEYISRLNGNIKLIVGNHDVPFIEDYKNYSKVEVIGYPIILEGFWIISHEPVYISEQMPYANIFGHIHNNPMYKTVSSRSYCVCVERNGFKPVLFDDIKEAVRKENK